MQSLNPQILSHLSTFPKDAKIYVAGHLGLVGSAVVRQLKKYGFTNLLLRTHSELDLTKQALVEEFFAQEKPDYVILAAAKVGGIHANNVYRGEFIYLNTMIQANVIHASHLNGVKRLVFLGSSCIYPKNAPQPIKEEYLLSSTLEPTNQPYALAKISGIEMCWSYNRQYGEQYIALMPTNLYGIGDNYHPENSHVIPALIRKAHLAKSKGEKSMTLWGTGSPLREFLLSDDMAEACLFLMTLPDKELSPYLNDQEPPLFNVGCGKDCSIADICRKINQVVGFKGELEFDSSKPDGTPRKLLDVSKLSQLGWQASTPLEEGLKLAYQDYLARYHPANDDIVQVVLCGGSGSRLWPLSSKNTPKQFNPSLCTPTLFDQTMDRFEGEINNYLILTNQNYQKRVLNSLAEHASFNSCDVVFEPEARNTFPALLSAAQHLVSKGEDKLMLVCPSDHYILNPQALYQALTEAKDYVKENEVILTFGIKATSPATKYGYIEVDRAEQFDKSTKVEQADKSAKAEKDEVESLANNKAFFAQASAINASLTKASSIKAPSTSLLPVKQFKEKPNAEQAQAYLEAGNYLWNSGIFLFKASTLVKLSKELYPHYAQLVAEVVESAQKETISVLGKEVKLFTLGKQYGEFEKISFDYAILEKAPQLFVKEVNLTWSDMGTWDAVYQYSKSDENNNILLGEVFGEEIKNSYIKAESKPIIALGVENLVVVENEDLLLISSKEKIDQANSIIKAHLEGKEEE